MGSNTILATFKSKPPGYKLCVYEFASRISLATLNYLEGIKRDPPWVTATVLLIGLTIELFAGVLGYRAELLNLLALTHEKWYTISTYWSVHNDHAHACGNLITWCITSTFIEGRFTSKRYAAWCVLVTLLFGIMIMLVKMEALSGDDIGKGLSILTNMAIVPAMGVILQNVTAFAWRFRAGIFLTCALFIYGSINGQNIAELPSSMIGHAGGTVAGFTAVIAAIRHGKYTMASNSEQKDQIYQWVLAVLFPIAVLIGIPLACRN